MSWDGNEYYDDHYIASIYQDVWGAWCWSVRYKTKRGSKRIGGSHSFNTSQVRKHAKIMANNILEKHARRKGHKVDL